MIKYFSMKSMLTGSIMFVVSATFLFVGCAHLSVENSDTLDISSEKMHQIEPLELKEAPEEEEVVEIEKTEPAPAVLEISMEQCRAWALENNLDLKAQLIAPSIATERVSQEEAQFEAVFSGSISYSKTNMPVATLLDISGNEGEYTYTDLGVNIPLRTGGEIKFDLNDNKKKTNSENFVYNPSYEPDFSASISQPLLRNAGRRVNEYAIRIAEYNSRIADAQTKLKAIYIISYVDRYYWKLYAAKRLLDVRKQQYELAKALYDETAVQVNVGTKAEIEMIRTRAGIAERLEAIINAENNLMDIERTLKQMLNKSGLEIESPTALIPMTDPDPIHYEIKSDEMVSKAMENRMELLELEFQLAQDGDSINYFKNQTLPSMTLGYKYNMNGLGSTRGDSYDLLSENDFHDHSIGLQISIPIGNDSAKSRLRQARYERAQRLVSRESKRAQIKTDVLRQIDTLEANWQRILACRQTTILKDEQYKAEKRLYDIGMVTSTDVLDAQTNLADAQRNEISALAEYQIALVDLAYATGTLLGAAKIEWAPFIPDE